MILNPIVLSLFIHMKAAIGLRNNNDSPLY